MSFLTKDFIILNKKISFAAIVWYLFALVAITLQVLKGLPGIHNYLIFKGVFWHSVHQTDLYAQYQADLDLNHYGPLFSLVIAPFALLPDIVGCFLWGIANALFLFYAVRKLPLSYTKQNIVLLIGALEMMTSMHNVQYNPMVTSWIILSYILVQNKNDFWATLFIALGILTKIYGIVGLAFFLFSDHKMKFILSFIFWCAVLFVLPMLISSPGFIIKSYQGWYLSVTEKNVANQESTMQGMSAIRVLKRVFLLKNLPDIYVLVTAAILYLLPLVRISLLKVKSFQLSYLAFLLIGVVIFSSSAESSTYVIAMMGVGIWFVVQKEKNYWVIALLVFALLLTSLSTTDVFPRSIKADYVRPFALKALPCFIIWVVLCFQLIIGKFNKDTLPLENIGLKI
ncbi:MAG: DUF2029 domain-containing protein [Ferruginibacter sp.]|nr:DUF2029 domain-containing protein [Ferruginibacter sp.]